jgi:protein SCO1/2
VPDVSWLRTAAALLFISTVGGGALWCGTDGFRAFTSEQARRNAVARAPRAIPNIRLESADGRAFTFAELRGRPVAVDFVYTQCKSVCTVLSAGFERIDHAQRSRTARERLPLLSITFDPDDTPDRLTAYAARYHADGETWRLARVRDTSDLPALLRAFGIVVIPDGRGDFHHNAAVHIVDSSGRLSRVLDANATPDLVARAALGQ